MALTTVSLMLLSCLIHLSQEQEGQEETRFPLMRCPKASKDIDSHCYALYSTRKSWHEAELVCQKWPSGHLVSVLNGAEAYYVSSLLKSSTRLYEYVWIGLHDPSLGREPDDRRWEWSSNEALHYFNWEKHPPLTAPRGYCGSLTESSGYLKWINFQCDIELPFVCKFKN